MTERTVPHASELRGWRKSSHSSPEKDSCVEVIDDYPAGVPVRDSKAPNGPALVFPTVGWSAFITAVKDGGLRA